jgi:hypothetical protein
MLRILQWCNPNFFAIANNDFNKFKTIASSRQQISTNYFQKYLGVPLYLALLNLLKAVLRIRIRIRIRIHRIHVFLGLQDPDPDPLVRGMDPDPDPALDPDPDPSIIRQKK